MVRALLSGPRLQMAAESVAVPGAAVPACALVAVKSAAAAALAAPAVSLAVMSFVMSFKHGFLLMRFVGTNWVGAFLFLF